MSKKIQLFNIRNIDAWIMFAGLMYIILPVLIFLLKFTRIYYFFIGLILFGALTYKTMRCVTEKNNGFSNSELLSSKSLKYLFLASLALFIWVYFSGIGNYAYQNWDFWVRNPIYNDLCSKSWPMYYNLAEQGQDVTNLLGAEWVAFSYYFAFWLTPASICKILHLTGKGCQLVLFLYSFIGIEIVHYLLLRLYRKFSWKITAILITFSGLDIVGRLIYLKEFPTIYDDIEWSLTYFQCSSNLTQLYYVFNQSLPIWILMLIILNTDSPEILAALAAICFAYSPWATIGLVPIAVAGALYKRNNTFAQRIKACLTPLNVLIPIFMLVIFGLYYSASGGASGGKGIFAKAMGVETGQYVYLFIIYILTEFGLYYIAMGKDIIKYRYSVLVFIELTLFPIYYIVDFNFFLRGTMPSLFILMTIIIAFLTDTIPESLQTSHSTKAASGLNIRKKLIVILLCIGAFTPLFTFNRSVIKTCYETDILQTTVTTFDNMTGIDQYYITTANSQFFVHAFSAKTFYRYISKIGL